jgi:hypothetical protein
MSKSAISNDTLKIKQKEQNTEIAVYMYEHEIYFHIYDAQLMMPYVPAGHPSPPGRFLVLISVRG